MFKENRRTKLLTLTLSCFGLFMVLLDVTIVNNALPAIQRNLDTSLSGLQWIIDAYTLVFATLLLTAGALSDRQGRKRWFMIGLAVFTIGSALCGLAPNEGVLVASRALQAAGGAALSPASLALLTGAFPDPRERAQAIGIWSGISGLSLAAGPLIGGALVDGPGWRWVFFVNLPVGLVALVGLRLRLPAPAVEPPEHPLDGVGAALLAAATSTLMLACLQNDGRPALIAATIALCAALVVQERRAADPIVPLRLLRTRTVAVVSTALFLATAALFAVTVFVPLFLQTVTGASPTEAGLLLVPAMLGITVSTTVSGRIISRTGRYKRFPVAGLALMTGALVTLAIVARDPSRLATGIALAGFGLGFGLVTQVLVTAVQNAVERRELGVATATTGFFRALGGAVGAAVLGAVFAAHTGVNATDGDAAGVIGGVQSVFLVAAPLAALALVAVLALVETPLKTAPRHDRKPVLPTRQSAASGASS
jgi:EmrB/QacA subfamily drug resistance transporter